MIFTGLSNNWALLQRVNAIEKYLSENPIVPYAKASVAGEGTDTFVFDKSQLSVANGAGLMVGDLIICPDVTLWQVISIADSGEVTARFLVNFKGEQGIQGKQGKAIIINVATIPITSSLTIGADFNILFENCTETPEVGDYIFSVFSGGSNLNGDYVGLLKATNTTLGGDFFVATVVATSYNLRGEKGKDGLSALVATHELQLPVAPTVGGSMSIAPFYLNREPKLNEKASVFVKDTTENVVYECYGTFTSISSDIVFTFSSVTRITGENAAQLSKLNSINLFPIDVLTNVSHDEGGFTINGFGGLEFNDGDIDIDGSNAAKVKIPLKATNGIVADVSEDGKFIELHAELYKHTIIFEQEGHTRILMQLYTRSATPMSYDDIASYLTDKETSASGIHNAADFSSTTLYNFIYSVYANAGVLYTRRLQNSGAVSSTEISKTNVTTTDTVEEI